MATPLLGSYYGKERKPIRFMNANCSGSEKKFVNCPITTLSQRAAEAALSQYDIASVDCVYDTPTDPPCVPRPSSYDTAGSECSNNGQIRLQGGNQQGGYGRLEYCYNGYWSPFCKMDPKAAMVACREFGFTSYSCKEY